MTNAPSFDKSYAIGFMNRYPGIVEHWQAHGDILKRGLAIMLKEAATGASAW